MTGQIVRRFRRTAPPLWSVAAFLFLYLSIETLVRFVRGMSEGLDPGDVLVDFYRMRATIATVAAVAYGAYRLIAFHPVTRPNYRQWLEQTPWTPQKALPLGPTQLGIGDLLVVGILCWLAGRDYPIGTVAPAFGFLTAHYLATCLVAGLCRQRATLYALAFGLVVVIRLGHWMPAALLAMASLYPIARLGIRRTLEPACWPPPDLRSQFSEMPGIAKDAGRKLGWPHGPLGPHLRSRIIVWPETALVPLLAGGLAYAVLSHFPFRFDEEEMVRVVIAMATSILCFGQIAMYVGGYWPPISIFGRLLTGRWIIPGYDKVFVGPLATISAYFVLEVAFSKFDLPPAIAQPIVITVCLAILMNVGPTLSDWRLTGRHRMSTFGFQANRNQFRQV